MKHTYELFSKLSIFAGCIFLSNLIGYVYAHQNHAHTAPKPVVSSLKETERQIKLSKINEEYKKLVKPFFIKSCFNCHSQQTNYPWYYKMPIAKQLIDSDVAEAKKHIDLTNDFPFGGHGLPEEDLAAIHKSIEKDVMPPFRYKVLHPDSKINDAAKKIILRWISDSLNKLSK